MKTFEIEGDFYKKDIGSIRQFLFVLIIFGLIFNAFISFYKDLSIFYFLITSFLLLLIFIIKINFRISNLLFSKFQFCHKIIIDENDIEFNFIHPFYSSKIVKKYKKTDLLISSTQNHSLHTLSFQKNSQIYISNLFEITNNKNGWSEKQLKEILLEFK